MMQGTTESHKSGPLVSNNIDQLLKESLRDRYTLKHILGKRPGRRTFLAKSCKTGQPVAIKVMLFGPDFTWEALKLFEREAQTLQTVDHPAIPKYLDFFEIDTPLIKGFALVQTYIQAKSLQTLVTAGRRFSESELTLIAQSLLTTLHYLHSAEPSVIHRDIKPSNILLSEPADSNASNPHNSTLGQLSLIDFGSVQTLQHDGTMTIVGTYGYMAPEQFGGKAKPASDLYGLGATLIYLATGEHPVELMQDGMQIEFASNLSETFKRWLQQLITVDLSKRTESASVALHQLTLPQPKADHTEDGQPSEKATAIEKGTARSIHGYRLRRQQAQQRSRADFTLYYLPEERLLEQADLNNELSQKPVLKELEIEFLQQRLQGKGLGLTLPDMARAHFKRVRFHSKQAPFFSRKSDVIAILSLLPLVLLLLINGTLLPAVITLGFRLAVLGVGLSTLYHLIFTGPLRL
ncbi:MAG: serine/threonine-protein kinase, partial [Cyanobacteria bacterium J06555_13]